MTVLETDYLVVGAGAAGMAFTDSLLADSDADVVIVDRRHRPGGHWNAAYPFVRLHQPSAFYGVNSRSLGTDTIDEVGPNAGFYERATAGEILDYFQRVLEEHLVPSGRVRFFGMSDYLADGRDEHQFVSRLTGDTTTVRVRRKVVDATYLETPVPSTHTPPFGVDDDARFIPVNGLVTQTEPAQRLHGDRRGQDRDGRVLLAPRQRRRARRDPVDPPARRVDPRPRAPTAARAALPQLIEGVSFNLEAAAEAESVDDLFRRLEAHGQLVRIDPAVEPTMYRCATLSQGELESLRTIEHVVRHGRVVHVAADKVVLEEGSLPTRPGHVYVDCSAAGLRCSPARPIFEADRITLQQVRTCQPTFNAAFLAFVEAVGGDDAREEPAVPAQPVPERGDRLDGGDPDRPARAERLARGSRRLRMDGPVAAQRRPRRRRPSPRPGDAVGAGAHVRERRAGDRQPRAARRSGVAGRPNPTTVPLRAAGGRPVGE